MTVSYRTPRLGAAHPNHSAPSLGSCFGLMTPFVSLSPNYFTLARFKPRRCASLIAQLLRLDHLADRVSMTWAASNSATRTEASPTRLMQPTLSVSPDWYLRGVLATAPFCRPPVLGSPLGRGIVSKPI